MSKFTEITEDELQAFVDGRLDARRHAAVLAHLKEYPEELQRLGAYAEQKTLLRRRLDDLDLTHDDPTTLRLQHELEKRLTRSPRTPWLRQAAAVALLLGAGWWSNTVYYAYLADRLPPVVIEAAQAHEVFGDEVQRPVELNAAARTEIAAWFSRHLNEPVEIPSLRAVGLRLIGGRLLAGDEGPVAQLLYEDGAGHRLTLCLSSEPVEIGAEFRLAEVEGLTAGYWQEGEIIYAVVAKTSDDQLAAIATELGAQESGDRQ